MSWLRACSTRLQYPVIPNERPDWYTKKCRVLHFGGNNLRNETNYALQQYRTLIVNRIWHLEVPKIAFRTHRMRVQRLTCRTFSELFVLHQLKQDTQE